MTKIYNAPKDHYTLEPYYSMHVSAMTGEKLFEKSDIAAELAHRDKKIADLEYKLASMTLNPWMQH